VLPPPLLSLFNFEHPDAKAMTMRMMQANFIGDDGTENSFRLLDRRIIVSFTRISKRGEQLLAWPRFCVLRRYELPSNNEFGSRQCAPCKEKPRRRRPPPSEGLVPFIQSERISCAARWPV
jgi:hypothetical protein